MLRYRYESREDFEDTLVWYREPKYALGRYDIRMMNDVLSKTCEQEANRMYRLARRMKEHGCSDEAIEKCHDEANALWWSRSFPHAILDPDVTWTYAFQC